MEHEWYFKVNDEWAMVNAVPGLFRWGDTNV
jgi:hypothetical protein